MAQRVLGLFEPFTQPDLSARPSRQISRYVYRMYNVFIRVSAVLLMFFQIVLYRPIEGALIVI